MQQRILYIGWAILAAVVVYAFVLVGSPAHNRDVLTDKVTLEDLSKLNCAINAFYREKGRAPFTVQEVVQYARPSENRSSQCGYCQWLDDSDQYPVIDRTQYEYIPAAVSYKICAHFHVDWDEFKKNQNVYHNLRWAEGFKQGKHCFERKLTKCDKK